MSSNITNEKIYQATMHFVRKMLYDGIISEVEYSQINAIFIQKYQPVLGTLFSEIPLTSLQKRVIYSNKEV